jgi:hypothetical protein
MSTETIILPSELTEIVGDIEVPCDWGSTSLHVGDGPARWIAVLRPCVCGRTGVRLICTHCKDVSMQAEDAAMCGACGEVYVPWRSVIYSIESIA